MHKLNPKNFVLIKETLYDIRPKILPEKRM